MQANKSAQHIRFFLAGFLLLFTLFASPLQADPPDWVPAGNLQFNMQVTGILLIEDNVFSVNEEDLVAAFVNNECRGLATRTSQYPALLFLNIGSNLTSGDSITFKAYLSELDLVVELNQTLIFTSGAEVGNINNPYVFTHDGTDRIISATVEGDGIIVPMGETTVAYGDNQLFSIIPNTGAHVSDVLVDSLSVGAVDSYLFENVNDEHTIHAKFSTNVYMLAYLIIGDGGTIEGEAFQMISHGEDGTTVEVVPDDGYYFTEWDDGQTDNPRTDYNITESMIVTCTLGITSYPLVYTAASNGYLDGNTSQVVQHGGDGSPVEAFGEIGYEFLQWSDGSSENPRTDVNITGPVNVMAHFALKNHSIEASADENGSITPTGNIFVEHGSDTTFVIQPNIGYQIADVLVDDESVGPVSDYTFTSVSQDHSIHASFELASYTLTYLAESTGSIEGEAIQIVEHGAHGSPVLAVPMVSHQFDSWSDGSTMNPRVDVNVTTDITVTAAFVIKKHTITASAGENGSISPDGEIEVDEGSSQGFTITADPGYEIADVLVDGSSVGPAGYYEFVNVTEDHSIHAVFESTTYTLTYDSGENGSLLGDTVQQVAYGEDGTAVEAIPSPGYIFTGWSDGNNSNPRTDINVTGNITVMAGFSADGPPNWTPADNLEYNMQIIGVLSHTDSTHSIDPGDMLGAFVNGECRGVASPIPGLDGLIFLTINSDQHSGELVTFKAYIEQQSIIVNLNESISFVSMSEMGTINDPFQFTYTEITYIISATADSTGSIDPAGDIMVPHWGNQNFIVTPHEGYHIADVWIDNESVGVIDTVTFEHVFQNHSIHASFAINTYAIFATSGDNGSISPADSVMVNHGADTLFTFQPDEGYAVYNVTVNGDSMGAMNAYQFTEVTQDQTIHVEFDVATSLQSKHEDAFAAWVYPNPSAGTFYLNIRGKGEYLKNSSVTVYDYSGSHILEKSLYSNATELSLNLLSPGIYYLRIRIGSQHIETIKISKLP